MFWIDESCLDRRHEGERSSSNQEYWEFDIRCEKIERDHVYSLGLNANKMREIDRGFGSIVGGD